MLEQVPLCDRRLKCGIHVIVSVRRIVLHLPANSDARPPHVGSWPSASRLSGLTLRSFALVANPLQITG